MSQVTGDQLIAGRPSRLGATEFRAVNPATAKPIDPPFTEATPQEIDAALSAASQAFESGALRSPQTIAELLEAIASEILKLEDSLIELAMAETGLGKDRLIGERARTVGQLRMFATLVSEGSWVDARIDTADPNRKPLPKPDVRRMLVPLGPVVVFGASNFPFAFSVAGGDTASALAAGNPVVFKAHPAHPGTSELVARAIGRAAASMSLPAGVFSLIQGTGHSVGLDLVKHPLTEAVAFTGSLRGGRALFDAAVARPRPIPLFAEMGSINPVFVLPGAAAERGEAIAKGLGVSVTVGVGQFCTNPGLVVGIDDALLDSVARGTADAVASVPPGTMLYEGLARNFAHRIERALGIPGVNVLKRAAATDVGKTQGGPIVMQTHAKTFLQNETLREECFGPSTLFVACGDAKDLETVARELPGQLTATIHGTEKDLLDHAGLVGILTRKVGRLLFNGFPTGVEVCSAMHHGGPYPATTDSRHTSVGSAAILRFARPVCYQGFPQSALPPELRDQNERGIMRIVNNAITRDDVGRVH